MRAFSWLLLAIWMTLSASAQLAGTNTTVRLIFSASEVKAGDEVVAAFQFRMNEGWHTYWQNAGESGKPIEISWKLPTGIEAGPIQWPVPEKIDTGGIFTYGYHGEATLLVPLRVAANVPAGEHRIEAELNWLECADVCLPADTNLVGSIRVGFETKSSSSLAVFDQARAKLPKDGKPLKLIAQWVAAPKGDEQDLWLEFTPNVSGGTWDFYPFASEEMELAGMTTNEPSAGTKLRLRKTAKRLGQDWPKQIAGLLVHAAKPGAAPDSGYEVRATILRPGMELSSGGLEPKPAVGTTPTSIWGMLVAAFVGGLILNIMPCVLPVISLKILGFVQQTGEGKGRARRLGFIYALGVLTSFMILAGVIIAVKAAGGNAIWGMQFQNPIFIVSLITLVLLVALNLFGVFEVNLGGGAMTAAGTLATREGAGGAFFNGVLTTVLATPCSAPFLGAALGFAFTQRPLVIVVVFAFIAAGLAFPYVLLSSKPEWLRFLPKPGLWMVRFKQVMGFPMIATAFYLMDTALALYGSEHVFTLGLFLVAVAVAAWIWGEFAQRGIRPALSRGIALGLLVFAYLFFLEHELKWREARAEETSSVSTAPTSPDGLVWQNWSPEVVEEARKLGKPIFVDFTARWCPNCRANKRLAVDVPSVRAKVKELGVIMIKADITTRASDPIVVEEITRYGRAAIPLNLVYPADGKSPPEVLPVALTPGIVIAALERAAQSAQTAAR